MDRPTSTAREMAALSIASATASAKSSRFGAAAGWAPKPGKSGAKVCRSEKRFASFHIEPSSGNAWRKTSGVSSVGDAIESAPVCGQEVLGKSVRLCRGHEISEAQRGGPRTPAACSLPASMSPSETKRTDLAFEHSLSGDRLYSLAHAGPAPPGPTRPGQEAIPGYRGLSVTFPGSWFELRLHPIANIPAGPSFQSTHAGSTGEGARLSRLSMRWCEMAAGARYGS